MGTKTVFTEEELVVDEGLGYPEAYAKLCRNTSLFNPYSPGPPLEFIPCAFPLQEAAGVKELSKIFPIIDPGATPSVDPDGFVNLLWKQLSHLGNAGFDPALFRVDPYGNVLYFHADPASPLFWCIDHWFPCSRGGRTVPSNLRLLQWQVFRKKHNRLEFLIPWWDLQLGISVNQFICIFASKNSNFRNRAFSFLFKEGGNEELNESEEVHSHKFPQNFVELKQQVGLAPAAIVLSQRHRNTTTLKQLRWRQRSSLGEDDYEGLSKSIQSLRPRASNENNNLSVVGSDSNPYISITPARDSLWQDEESKKVKNEITSLENEMNVLRQKNELERIALQDLEILLIKKKRRVEKCRRLAESQSSYKALLEKMIRDAMHQSVVYKEQVRLNQVANSALMARLEAQRAICDASEKELHRKYRQRDDMEKQITPCWEQARKIPRVDSVFDEKHQERMNAMVEEKHEETVPSFPARRSIIVPPIKKELRQFLEEELKASEAGLSLDYEQGGLEHKFSTSASCGVSANNKTKKAEFENGNYREINGRKSVASSQGVVDDEEQQHMVQLGKYNVDRWVETLLGNAKEKESSSSTISPSSGIGSESHTEEIIHKPNLENPEKEIKFLRLQKPSESREFSDENSKVGENRNNNVHNKLNLENPDKGIKFLRLQKPSESREFCDENSKAGENRNSKNDIATTTKTEKVFQGRSSSAKNRRVLEERNNMADVGSSCASEDFSGSKNIEWNEMEWRKGRGMARSDSARHLRSLPSSPSVILGMKRSMDCMKKPLVMEDNDNCNNNHVFENNKTVWKRTVKGAVKK